MTSSAALDSTCDRLSHLVDETQFERLRWARNEGPMLARLVELAQGAFAEREDFELTEEGASRAEKRFVLKIHGTRIIAIVFGLDAGRATLRGEPIERSRYAIAPGAPLSGDFTLVDAPWMAGALDLLLGRIQTA